MTIRDATEKDIPTLVDIIREANQVLAEQFNLTPENTPKHPSNCTPEWIQDAFDTGINYYLLENEGSSCGCVALEQPNEDLCYLERLAVLPEYQGRGFGEALVKHVFTEAKKRNAQRVEIGTIAEHSKLSDWYQKLGFLITGTRSFEHLPFNVTFMTKEL